MGARSTTSEYQPAPPSARLSGKAAFARAIDSDGDDLVDGAAGGGVISSGSSAGVSKANKSGGPPLASGNRPATGSRGLQK